MENVTITGKLNFFCVKVLIPYPNGTVDRLSVTRLYLKNRDSQTIEIYTDDVNKIHIEGDCYTTNVFFVVFIDSTARQQYGNFSGQVQLLVYI